MTSMMKPTGKHEAITSFESKITHLLDDEVADPIEEFRSVIQEVMAKNEELKNHDFSFAASKLLEKVYENSPKFSL